jgi:hypothetical protein
MPGRFFITSGGPTMSDERETFSEGWIYTYDRRTGRPLARERLTQEEIRGLRARRIADGTPSPPAEPLPSAGDDRFGLGAITSYTYHVDDSVAPPPYRFEHDPAARVYRLTAPDGTVEAFRDHPTRYLSVEPDAESGQMRPVTKRGRPVYLYLCREDREAR